MRNVKQGFDVYEYLPVRHCRVCCTLRQLLPRVAARQPTDSTNSSSPDGSGTAAAALLAPVKLIIAVVRSPESTSSSLSMSPVSHVAPPPAARNRQTTSKPLLPQGFFRYQDRIQGRPTNTATIAKITRYTNEIFCREIRACSGLSAYSSTYRHSWQVIFFTKAMRVFVRDDRSLLPHFGHFPLFTCSPLLCV